jgi:hypothetical protein
MLLFVLSDEKSCVVSATQSLCGVTLDIIIILFAGIVKRFPENPIYFSENVHSLRLTVRQPRTE